MSFGFGATNSNQTTGNNSFAFGGANNASRSPFGAPSTGSFGSGATTGSVFGNSAFSNAAKPPPSTGFGTFGSTPATTNTFGSNSGVFGSTTNAPSSGFGTTGTTGFGSASTGFASGTTGFGSTSTTASPFAKTTPSSPFGNVGAFGANQNTATSGFGSAFGNTLNTPAAQNGTNAFGAPTPSTNTFGSGTFGAAKSPFGSGTATTPGFGTQNAASNWGSSVGGFGTNTMAASNQVGTGNPPYQPTREVTAAGSSNYISISRMNEYNGKSVEELRYEDYLKRTNPSAAAAAAQLNAPSVAPTATNSNTFGAQPTNAGGFGSAQPTGNSMFGNTNTSTFGGTSTGFGSTTTPSGAFGAPATSGFGTFGSSSFNAQPTSSSGAFGTAPSAFGTTSTPNQPFGATSSGFGSSGTFRTSTGAFGAPGTTNSAFGNTIGNQSTQPASSGFGSGGFGSNGSGGFGTNTSAGFGTTGSTFGKPAFGSGFGASTATPAATNNTGFFSGTTGNAFGATNTTSNPSSNSLFGNATGSSAFNFGANNAKPPTANAFGGFGAAQPSGFGSTPSLTTGSSVFGANNSGFGGFGAQANPATNNTNNMFNAPKSGGLFNSANTNANSTGMFGGSGSFGASGTNTGAFGTTAGSFGTGFGAGGFGQGGGTAFGASTNTPSFGFGTSGNTAPSAFSGFGNNTFGTASGQNNMLTAPNAQPAGLIAAPDINPYGSGSYGDGLLDQTVKAALDNQAIKVGSNRISTSSRVHSFAEDVGLKRGSIGTPSSASRLHFKSASRRPLCASYFRGPLFKTPKTKVLHSTSSLASSVSTPLRMSHVKKTGDSLSLGSQFRKSWKKLIIDNDNTVRYAPRIAEKIPAVVSDSVAEESDDRMRITFQYGPENSPFSLDVSAQERLQDTKKRITDHIGKHSFENIVYVCRGKKIDSEDTWEAAGKSLQLQNRDVIDIVVTDHKESKITTGNHHVISGSKQTEPTKFVSYDEFLSSTMRNSDDVFPNDPKKSMACPILTKTGYYTIPPYGRICRMSDQELAQVRSFTVGCHGLGSVEWIGLTDIRNLNLDELVTFEKKEVMVYKDDEDKHPLGDGLNKPAIVELLEIFPPNLEDKTAVKRYKERVIQRTKDIDADFVDYSAEAGIWRFRVEHFSRYGIKDDEDDAPMDGSREQGKDESPKHAENPLEIAMDHAMTSPVGFSQKRLKLAIPTMRRLFHTKHTVQTEQQQTTLKDFHMEMTARAPMQVDSLMSSNTKSSVDESKTKRYPSKEFYSHLELKDEEIDATEMVEFVSYTGGSIGTRYEYKPWGIDSESRNLLPGKLSPTYAMLQASLAQSTSDPLMTSGQVHSQADVGLLMARSFRCSWGPRGELAYCGKLVAFPNTQTPSRSFSTVSIALSLQIESIHSARRDELRDTLELHYTCATFSSAHALGDGSLQNDDTDRSEDKNVNSPTPLFEIASRLDVIHALQQYSDFMDKKKGSYATQSPKVRRHIEVLWKLVQALWGQEKHVLSDNGPGILAVRDDACDVELLDMMPSVDLRREAISRWMETAIDSLEDESACSTPTPEQSILQLLCKHQIVEASELAAESGNLRLATLVAQIATYDGSNFRHLIMMQLSQWGDDESLSHFSETHALIYSILAGAVEAVTASSQLGLSWLSAIALFFWYKYGPSTSLKSALSMYQSACSKNLAAPCFVSACGSTKNDILVEVLRLYAEEPVALCNVLSPSGFLGGNSAYLDYEVSWHLYTILHALGYQLDPTWESHLYQNFIRQLEGTELWQEALYVTLNIPNPKEREATCRALLLRHSCDLAQLPEEKLEELKQKLKIPVGWIESTLALDQRYKSAYHFEIGHWMAAKMYDEAHSVLIKHIAARLFFSNDKQVLRQLLEEMEPVASTIPLWNSFEWHLGGGLWLEFLRLEQDHDTVTCKPQEIELRLTNLALKLKDAPYGCIEGIPRSEETYSVMTKACVSSMLITLMTVAKAIKSASHAMESGELAIDPYMDPAFLFEWSSILGNEQTLYMETHRLNHVHKACSAYLEAYC
uniref:Nuclear pore complex protein putative n=1 Tax=Albugo laibachii Nc14 TaxID=890382 RepID=F0WIM4_9STRA|nr:nuclear pore complex protein putative [Albugo laibachii Nc14]|eukprot:CCA21109.1 nuclear pore complex protein putative [Albugo laibachii Nc14]